MMTENEKFELCMNDNGQLDIIDHFESEEKNAICIYNDLGVPPFSSAKALCDKLNEQDKRIKELEDKLNQTALFFLNYDMITMGKAVEISEMSYHDFLKYRKENGNSMELQL